MTCKTRLTELAEKFGQGLIQLFGYDENDGILIFQKNADDGIRIEVKNGKLAPFEYWSPC